MNFNRLLVFALLCLMYITSAFGQGGAPSVDVTQLVADTKTFIFNDGKSSVKNYIYEVLDKQTTCCGPARMYVEVKVDPSGYVVGVKPLTGLQFDCYAKSVSDIVKNIKWDASGFQAAKSIYFEIKPEITCNEKDNVYRQIKVFNNELVDENGVPLNYAGSTGVPAKAPGAKPAGQPIAAATQPAATQPAATTPTGVPSPPPQTPSQAQPATQPAPAKSDVATTPMPPVSTGQKQGSVDPKLIPDRNASDAQLQKAQDMAALQAKQQQEEIERLKKQLADAKEQERLAAEAKKREEMRAKQDDRSKAVADAGGYRDTRGKPDDYDTMYDDPKKSPGTPSSSSRAPQNDPPRQMTQSERMEDEKRRLEAQLAEMQNRQRQLESQNRQAMSDAQRTTQDIVRLQEQLLRQNEQIAQQREREELERIENDRRVAEQRKIEQERAAQAAMDELKRKQAELDRMITELQRIDEEAKKKAQEKLAREQAIAADQARRGQQIEMEVERLKMQSGVSGMASAGAMSTLPATINLAGIDTSKAGIALLAGQIQQLREEVMLLTSMIRGGIAPMPSTPRSGTAAATRGTASNNPVVRHAGTDMSWKGTDYKDPAADPGIYQTAAGADLKPGQTSTHANLPVPSVGAPVYRGGADAMKAHISGRMKEGSLCGLAQAVFEVTVDPSGKVVGQRILSASNPSISALLPGILNSLQFESTGNVRFTRTAMYEFKADIPCEGKERVNLNSVQPIIKGN